jgi:hypothetical protein
MRYNISNLTHIDPASAVLAFHEMLPLVLRFAAAPFPDDLARHDA